MPRGDMSRCCRVTQCVESGVAAWVVSGVAGVVLSGTVTGAAAGAIVVVSSIPASVFSPQPTTATNAAAARNFRIASPLGVCFT